MAATAADDLTEICNDDGFVYRRRKRSAPPPQPPNPSYSTITTVTSAEKRKRKELLQNIVKRYRSEMEQWDRFSSTLQELHLLQIVTSNQISDRPPRSPTPPDAASDLQRGARFPIDDILLQVEAQEAILDKLLGICGMVDRICDDREEVVMQSLLDLPVWAANPRTLVASLAGD